MSQDNVWIALPNTGMLLMQNKKTPLFSIRIIEENRTLRANMDAFDLFEVIDFKSMVAYAGKKIQEAEKRCAELTEDVRDYEKEISEAYHKGEVSGTSREEVEQSYSVARPRSNMASVMDQQRMEQMKYDHWVPIKRTLEMMQASFNHEEVAQ